MVWLYVIGYIVMGVVSVLFELYMVKNHYSELYRNKLKSDKSEVAAMIIGNFFLWWLVIPFHALRLAIIKIQKALQ